MKIDFEWFLDNLEKENQYDDKAANRFLFVKKELGNKKEGSCY